MPDYTARKTTIFTGINDTPVSPTALVAGNGSHLIANLNGLIDDLNGAVFEVAGAININNVQVLTTQQPAIDSLSDSTGGTINTTLYNVSGSGADTTINDNFASLNAQLEAILLAMRTHGLILTGGGGGS